MKGRAVGSKKTFCRKIQRRSQYCGTGRTKSIYGDNFKVVVAEAPATTKVALLILLNVQATSVRKTLRL